MRKLRSLGALAAALLLYTAVAAPLCAQPQTSAPSPWPETVVADPDGRERRELLLSHGINPRPEDLLAFLQNGFREEGLPMGLPRDPVMKSEVINAAIVELGLTATQPAVPVLMKAAKRQFSPAIEAIIRRDFESTPIEVVDSQIAVARRLLSLNAIVSLGLIGDDSAAPVVLEVMETENATGFTTAGAVALGQMGSAKGLPAVVKLAGRIESPDSVAAFRTVFILTGRNYGYTENTPVLKRRDLVKQLDAWMASEGSTFPVYRTEVLRRQQMPLRDSLSDTGSLRAQLRTSIDGYAPYDDRYTARQRLAEQGRANTKEFRAIALDPMEELDIRRAAMRWLAMVDASEAEKVMRRLRDDENASIEETAREILRDIPLYKEDEKARGLK